MKNIEKVILKNLLLDEPFVRKVIPYLKTEYFEDKTERLVFEEIQSYIEKYNQQPNRESLEINISNRRDLNESEVAETLELLKEVLSNTDQTDIGWLTDQSEKFCQQRSMYLAAYEALQIMDGKVGDKDVGIIPKLFSDALAVSFDPHIGHDYFDDADYRYEFYHKEETRIPFDLDDFNKITKGGMPNKTLSIVMAGTGVGKSLFMCHHAAACLSAGYDVLYITLEMSEERIAERIDANLLNVNISDLEGLTKDQYDHKLKRLKENVKGKLIIKEYPTASAHAGHFKALMNDLALKKKFRPKIVFVDYLNICASSRIKHGSNVNSYSYVKAIAEELRGFAIEFDVPVWSATQTTRSGFNNSDPGLEDTAESFGLPHTADFMFVMISDEDLAAQDRVMIKQLKNRYNDPNFKKRFPLGINRPKMRLFDAEEKEVKQYQDTGKQKAPGEAAQESDVMKAMKAMISDANKNRFLDKLKT